MGRRRILDPSKIDVVVDTKTLYMPSYDNYVMVIFSKKKKDLPTTDDARKTRLPSGSKVRSTRESADRALKAAEEKAKRTEEFKKRQQSPRISNVYSADFSEIDAVLEDCKKHSRAEGVSAYACDNIYSALSEALRKIKLAQR